MKSYIFKVVFFVIIFNNFLFSQPILLSPSNGEANISITPTLSWNASNGADSYRLQVSESNQFTTTVFDQNNLSATSKQISGLSNSKTYFWRVNAENDNGNSDWSIIWSFTTGITNSCPGLPSITYAGQTYSTVQIGTQCWLRENLNIGKRINGIINQKNNGIIEKYCYDDKEENCSKYGGLYQWDEVMQYVIDEGAQGICPTGWHVPTLEEFKKLSNYVGDKSIALLELGEGSGTNTSGFSALLAGYRKISVGTFPFLGIRAYMWCSTIFDLKTNHIENMYLIYNNKGILFDDDWKGAGYSVRCLKDQTSGPNLTVTPSSKDVSFQSGSTTFNVSSNVNWSDSVNESWINVTPSSGNNSGTITAAYTENTESVQRVGTITITGGEISKTISITQAAKPPNSAPTVTSAAVTKAIIGLLYSYDVNASGSPAPTYSLTTFPAGMTINQTSGLIQWTPSSVGNFDVTVTASNGVIPDALQSFTITVNEQQSNSCPPSLISYWKLDETTGTVYQDYIGINNATTTNAPNSTLGRVNGAQLFNGTSNKISAPRIANYDFDVNSSFTFESWIKHPTNSYNGEEIILERKDPGGALVINLKFNSKFVTFLARSTSGELFAVTGSTNLFDDKWHHIVGLRDASLNQLRIYVDGILKSSASARYNSGFNSKTAGISIGWRNNTDPSYFKGTIDEVAIYNTALDQATITNHYNNGLLGLGYCQINTLAKSDLSLQNIFSSTSYFVTGNSIHLVWETITNLGKGKFVIERISDMKDWQKIGEIELLNELENNTYSYTDTPNKNGKLTYRIKLLKDGVEINSNEIEMNLLPNNYKLSQNYPNPFNPTTTIKYSIPDDAYVTLIVYDVLGNQVSQLYNEYKLAGNYLYTFDASNLSSGIYFYTIRTGKFIETKKMILLK